MHQGPGVIPEYIVEVDTESVARARRTTVRALTFSACTSVVGGVLICAIPLAFALTLGSHNAPLVLWPIVLPGLILLFSGSRQFLSVRRLQRTWAATGIPPVAMRISAAGLGCAFDTAPLFLPWTALAGLRVDNRARRPVLVLDLAPGVTAATPGVVGLDHPDLQRALRGKVLGVKGLWLSVRSLRQPLAEIDQALAHFTGGRVRIR